MKYEISSVCIKKVSLIMLEHDIVTLPALVIMILVRRSAESRACPAAEGKTYNRIRSSTGVTTTTAPLWPPRAFFILPKTSSISSEFTTVATSFLVV